MGIYEKLFKLQGKLSPLIKNKDNPFFKSKYADINQILNMIKPLLQENKILLMQNPVETDGNKISIETVLVDIEDNTRAASVISLPYGTQDPQKGASSITYARRYAIVCMLCLQAVDDDGEGHKKKTEPKKTEPKKTAIERMKTHIPKSKWEEFVMRVVYIYQGKAMKIEDVFETFGMQIWGNISTNNGKFDNALFKIYLEN